jgi:hypothetical protein
MTSNAEAGGSATSLAPARSPVELLDEAPVDVEVEEAVVDDAASEALQERPISRCGAPRRDRCPASSFVFAAARRRRVDGRDGRRRRRSGRLGMPETRRSCPMNPRDDASPPRRNGPRSISAAAASRLWVNRRGRPVDPRRPELPGNSSGR